MADSTPTTAPRHRRLRRVLLACAGLVLLVALVGAPRARADGDPASDVLAAQSLFMPADGGFSLSENQQLTGLLADAARSDAPIRVALIATPADLGSVSALWGNPRGYAQFLGYELSQVFHGTLLVVMPSGFGVAFVGTPPPGSGTAAAATAALGTPARGTPMVAAAESAVQHLAAAAGHRLTLPTATAPPGSGSPLSSVDAGSWLALGLGAGLAAAAWFVSLRARPARLRGGPRRLRRVR